MKAMIRLIIKMAAIVFGAMLGFVIFKVIMELIIIFLDN